MNEFEKYATRHCGINSLKLHDFRSQYAAYVSPTIIEERQLNVATMDVFSWSRPTRKRTSRFISTPRADR